MVGPALSAEYRNDEPTQQTANYLSYDSKWIHMNPKGSRLLKMPQHVGLKVK